MPDNWLLETPSMIINPYRFAGGGTTPVDPGPDNLLAYWPLQEYSNGSAQVDRVDFSGNGYDLTDTVTTPSAVGKVGNAADFTAANSEYLDRSHVVGHNTDFSISVWVKMEAVPELDMTIIDEGDPAGGPNRNFSLFRDDVSASGSGRNDIYRFIIVDSTNTTYNLETVDGAANGTGWSHIVVTVGLGTEMRMYIDGVEISDGATSLIGVTALNNDTEDVDLAIGTWFVKSGKFWDGLIDEVRIYNDVLTPAEVLYLYTYPSGVVPATTITAPDHYWNLNNKDAVDTGDGLRDQVGSWHLTNSGATNSTGTGPGSADCIDLNVATPAYVGDLTGFQFSDIVAGTPSDNFSMSIWAQPDAISSIGNLIFSWRGSTATDVIVQYVLRSVTPDEFRASMYDSDGDLLGANAAVVADMLSPDVWFHCVVTQDGTTIKNYVNGVLVKETTDAAYGGAPTGVKPLTLGAPGWYVPSSNDTLSHDGKLALCGLWNATLTPAEVLKLYNEGNGYAYADLP